MTATAIHHNRADGTWIALGDPGDFAAYGHSTDHEAGTELGDSALWADPINGGSASSQWCVSPALAEVLAFPGAGD
jgi:hypothetical protein